MAFEALLLSHDPQAHRIISHTLDHLNIDLQVCSSIEQTLHILTRSRFDAVLVDCDDVPDGCAVLQAMRKNKSRRSCFVFALVHGNTSVQQAYEMGAHFVLDKPVSDERLTRSMRAAQGFLAHERRGHHRTLRQAAGAILVDTSIELPVTITNLSEGGISIECSRQLDEGGAARLRVLLPGSKKLLDLKGEIIWTTIEGRAGIRFQVLPIEAKEELETWMEKRTLPSGAVFINATEAALGS